VCVSECARRSRDDRGRASDGVCVPVWSACACTCAVHASLRAQLINLASCEGCLVTKRLGFLDHVTIVTRGIIDSVSRECGDPGRRILEARRSLDVQDIETRKPGRLPCSVPRSLDRLSCLARVDTPPFTKYRIRRHWSRRDTSVLGTRARFWMTRERIP
jgi:hypothetical protein